ncbi:hypothetical protein DLH72_03635 [Candidatus Gracilibacteria bacterium]|nr:MAG: hypothetical protein DLH72_03635 [Candidatus Gracilibacteria bacterium]
MLKKLINHFSLQEKSVIYNYILPIIVEHNELLQNIKKFGYSLDEAKLRENLRDGNIFIELYENEKFTDIIENLAGSECILQLYFSHPESENFPGPGSVIKLELSHNSFSGSF